MEAEARLSPGADSFRWLCLSSLFIRENLHLDLVKKDDKAFDKSLSGFPLYRPSKGGPRRSSDSSTVMEKPLFLSECFHSAPLCRDKDAFPRSRRGKRKRRGF